MRIQVDHIRKYYVNHMEWLYETLQLKFNQYFVIDDIFPEEVCQNLRDIAVDKSAAVRTNQYFGYYGQDYIERMKDVSDLIESKISLAKSKTYKSKYLFCNLFSFEFFLFDLSDL